MELSKFQSERAYIAIGISVGLLIGLISSFIGYAAYPSHGQDSTLERCLWTAGIMVFAAFPGFIIGIYLWNLRQIKHLIGTVGRRSKTRTLR